MGGFPYCVAVSFLVTFCSWCFLICGFKIAKGKKSNTKTERVHTHTHAHTQSQFLLSVVVMFYKVAVNTELANAKPLLLEEV